MFITKEEYFRLKQDDVRAQLVEKLHTERVDKKFSELESAVSILKEENKFYKEMFIKLADKGAYNLPSSR